MEYFTMEAYKDRKPRILIFKESMGGDLEFLMETDNAEFHISSVMNYFAEKKKLLNKEYDFILASPCREPVWHSARPVLKNISRSIATLLKNPSAYSNMIVRRLAQTTRMRLGIIDSIDAPLIPKRNFGLLDSCHRYFKRELPQNRYNIFLYTTVRNEDAVNIVRQDFFLKNEKKLRPIQLGISDKKFNHLMGLEKNEKEYDIFYAGTSHYCTVRLNGIKELLHLKKEGVKVYLPEERLSPEDFYMACGKSWLVLSPAGLGWDCNRHYEALAAGAVPVINYPWIEQYSAFVDRKHCFYYGVEPDGLFNTVREALKDKERLKKMNANGREWIMKNLTYSRILEYVIKEMMSE